MANKMTAFELCDILTKKGWKKDRWGHLKFEEGSKKYRLKIQKTSVRFEVRAESIKEWVRIDGSYFKDIVLIDKENEKFLKIGKKIIKI